MKTLVGENLPVATGENDSENQGKSIKMNFLNFLTIGITMEVSENRNFLDHPLQMSSFRLRLRWEKLSLWLLRKKRLDINENQNKKHFLNFYD